MCLVRYAMKRGSHQSAMDISSSTSLYDTEPIELRILKQQLANVSCRCNTCCRPDDEQTPIYRYEHFDNNFMSTEKNTIGAGKAMRNTDAKLFDTEHEFRDLENKTSDMKDFAKDRHSHTEFYAFPVFDVELKVAAVQTENQGRTDINMQNVTTHEANTVPKDSFCPTCIMALNLLRNGTTKILKDEDSATDASIFAPIRCDQSVGETIMYSAKFTSTTTVTEFSNAAGSEYSSSGSLSQSPSSIIRSRRHSSGERVKFADLPNVMPNQVIKKSSLKQCSSDHHIFMESFINAIRPPICSTTQLFCNYNHYKV